MMIDDGADRQFPSTQWSLVCDARSDDSETRREALAKLVERYYQPFLLHLTLRFQLQPDQVDDLLNGFIVDRMLQGPLLERADVSKGRLRCLLTSALGNYVKNFFKREQIRRGSPLPDDLVGTANVACTEFDVSWARSIFLEAIQAMRADCEGSKSKHWEVFVARILRPLLAQHPPVHYDQLVRDLGFESPLQACNALANAKRRWQRTLRQVVGQSVSSEAMVESEINDLTKILASAAQDARIQGVIGVELLELIQGNEIKIGIEGSRNLAEQSLQQIDRSKFWLAGEIPALLKHQLCVPPRRHLSEFRQGNYSAPLWADAQRYESLSALLCDLDAPLHLLNAMKDVFRAMADDREVALPESLSVVIYLACISSALLHCKQMISTMTNQEFRRRLERVLAHQWIDDPIRSLMNRTLALPR